MTPRFLRGLASVLVLAAACLSGCALERIAYRSVADGLAQGGDTFATDDDPDLIAAATPFALKSMETVLRRQPDHRGLLLALCRGYTQYSYAFVDTPADELEGHDVSAAYAQRDRARRLYLRARDYGLRGLGLANADAAARLLAEPVATLRQRSAGDASLLYWTGVSWAAAIALGKDSPDLVSGLPVADALVRRAEALSPDLEDGGLQTFLIGYEVARPGAAPDALDRARSHFRHSVNLTGGGQAAPYVALAEAIAQTRGQRSEYEALLGRGLAVDIDRHPAWRLTNRVAQRRARWLLSDAENRFPE